MGTKGIILGLSCLPHKHASPSICTPAPQDLGYCLLCLPVCSSAIASLLYLLARGWSSDTDSLLWSPLMMLLVPFGQKLELQSLYFLIVVQSSFILSYPMIPWSTGRRLILTEVLWGHLQAILHNVSTWLYRARWELFLIPPVPFLPAAGLLCLHFSFSPLISRPLFFGGFPASPQFSQSQILQPCIIQRVGIAVEHNIKELWNIALWGTLPLQW